MKRVLAIVAAVAALTTSSTFAADRQVPKSTLAEMGLGGMSVMSDAQGSQVRGQGFAFASSTSASALFGVTGNTSTATALNFNNAAAASGSASTAQLDILVGILPPGVILSIQGGITVGSSGYATASSN